MGIFKSAFEMFQEVYVITDPYKLKRIITAVTFSGNNCRYCLSCSELESWHFSQELKVFEEEKTIEAGFKTKQ